MPTRSYCSCATMRMSITSTYAWGREWDIIGASYVGWESCSNLLTLSQRVSCRYLFGVGGVREAVRIQRLRRAPLPRLVSPRHPELLPKWGGLGVVGASDGLKRRV